MSSIAINKAEHVCANVIIIKCNYILMDKHKLVVNTLRCVINYTVKIYTQPYDILTLCYYDLGV